MKLAIIYNLALLTFISLLSCTEKNKQSRSSDDEFLKSIQIPTNEKGEILSSEMAQIKLVQTELDLGQLKEGEIVKRKIKFYNIGKANLLISNVKSSCGCTIPSWPKNFIQPGDSSNIDVEYNSKDKSGFQEKIITVEANTNPSNTNIIIKANIKN